MHTYSGIHAAHPWQILSLPVYSVITLYTGWQGAKRLAAMDGGGIKL
ncbi:MAG: hypothetical protein LBD20_10315 [Spirochaetaceae bacterium]|nr:hypothetical protein [Spirochaetaceae bacterium]